MKQQPPCDDKASLIAYLYDECDAAERRLVEEHLKNCASCTTELANLRGVRVALREWAPPDQALGFRVVRDEATVLRPSRWWGRGGLRVPAWAQVAAAVLLLAAGAAIANLGVRRDAPSAADLARLERRLEQQAQQISALRAAAIPAPANVSTPVGPTTTVPVRLSAEVLRAVQTTIGDMERRQQRAVDQQIAERFLRFARDMDTQRITDQRRFLQGLSQIDVRTTQLSQGYNYLLRVANVQEIK